MVAEKDRIRVGVVGAGTFGSMHLQSFEQLARDERAVLVAVADRSETALARCREMGRVKTYSSHEDMLQQEQLDLVSVATPDPTHRSIVCDALAAGAHVLVEKPMDMTVAGCEAMLAAARENQRLLQVDFHKRYDEYHAGLQARVAAGELGRPLYGYAWMEDRIEIPRDVLRGWAAESSPVWFLGTHMIDLFRWIIGCRDGVQVFATGQKEKLVELGIDAWDAVQAQITFDDGIGFSLNVSWILPDSFESIVNQGVRFVGTEGLVEIDSQNRGVEACTAQAGQHTWNLGFKRETRDKWGRTRYTGYGYDAIMDAVENLEFLRDGGTLAQLAGTYPDGEDGLAVTRIAAAIHESLDSGAAVAV